jgi:hypothetical protein
MLPEGLGRGEGKDEREGLLALRAQAPSMDLPSALSLPWTLRLA